MPEQKFNPENCERHEKEVEKIAKTVYGNGGDGLLTKVGKIQTSMKNLTWIGGAILIILAGHLIVEIIHKSP